MNHVVTETAENGAAVFGSSHEQDISQSFRVDGAMLLSDRLQIGASLLIFFSIEFLILI